MTDLSQQENNFLLTSVVIDYAMKHMFTKDIEELILLIIVRKITMKDTLQLNNHVWTLSECYSIITNDAVSERVMNSYLIKYHVNTHVHTHACMSIVIVILVAIKEMFDVVIVYL